MQLISLHTYTSYCIILHAYTSYCTPLSECSAIYRIITRCLCPTSLDQLYILVGIALPGVKRSSTSHRIWKGVTLFDQLPPTKRLKSRKSFLDCSICHHTCILYLTLNNVILHWIDYMSFQCLVLFWKRIFNKPWLLLALILCKSFTVLIWNCRLKQRFQKFKDVSRIRAQRSSYLIHKTQTHNAILK